jgi:hypothetical protein
MEIQHIGLCKKVQFIHYCRFLMFQNIEKLTRILTKIKYKKERMVNQNNKQLFIDLVENEICVIEEHIKAIQNNIENNKKIINVLVIFFILTTY